MKYEEVKTPETMEKYRKVVQENDTIAKIDAVSTGIQQRVIETMEMGVYHNPNIISWVASDDDDELIGVITVKFGEKIPCWYAKSSFSTKIGRERYGTDFLFFKTWEFFFPFAEAKGYHELFYSQRIGRFRSFEPYMKQAPFLEKYKIDIVETIPEFSHSVNPLISKFIHGAASGLNPKPIVVVRIYNPDKVKYDYPYPPKN